MLRKKLGESLTARIFLITALILLCAGAVLFGLIAWATPITYTAVVNDELTRQVDALVANLEGAPLAESGSALDAFIRTTGANAILVGPDGQIADTGSQLAVSFYTDGTSTGDTATFTLASDSAGAGGAITVTASEQAAIAAEVHFPDQTAAHTLYVTPRAEPENMAVQALRQMAPWILLALLVFSLLCALGYSRYITRPIVRLSTIAGKMAELDFGWACGEKRRDEIGKLGRSLDALSQRLSAALTELESANCALRREVERERELDRARVAFFSAASHELKTPVTILKGQLTGMLEGVDVYRDRDTYLLRALQVTGRMEGLIQEILDISRMETGDAREAEPVELFALLEQQLSLAAGLMEQRRQHLVSALTPGVSVVGDAAALGKAVGNLLTNAAFYSPPEAEIHVWCGLLDGAPAFTVENTPAHIREDALPHLFEAFYRAEASRNRRTGGSGLGLYLVQMILERHGAACTIENTENGVRATVRFPAPLPE